MIFWNLTLNRLIARNMDNVEQYCAECLIYYNNLTTEIELVIFTGIYTPETKNASRGKHF